MQFGPYSGQQGSDETLNRRSQFQLLRIQTKEVLDVEDQPYARVLVNVKNAGRAVPQIVVFEDKAPADGFRQLSPGLDPACSARFKVPVRAARVNDENGFRSEFHDIEHLGLAFQVQEMLLRRSSGSGLLMTTNCDG